MSNYKLCASIKSKKNPDIQCLNKSKKDSDFCGKHRLKSIYFNNNNNNTNDNNTNDIIIDTIDDVDDVDIKDTSNIIDVNCINKIKEEELSIDNLFINIQENKYVSISVIRKTIKNTYLKLFIKIKQSKTNLIINIKKQILKERYYINHEDIIIKIQSVVRMFLKKNRYNCANEIDILTMDTKMEIEYPYFYKFYNKCNNKYYAYDIRLLHKLITSNYKSCPYTLRKFDDEEITRIVSYVNKIQSQNININIIKKLSDEDEIENKAKELFYKINMLDNYTNHKWFLDLDIIELVQLYISAEDIWNYRSSLSPVSKHNIIQDNYIFNIPIPVLRKIKYINKLRNILLDTFTIMVSNGIDINEKKLGAILVLSSLVEVSLNAAVALPHLVQG